jgi:enterochelin esterase-like enzyme
MTIGAIVLKMYDRSLAIHRKQCQRLGLQDAKRREEFHKRIAHIEQVMDEILPRYFPEHYAK